MKLGLIGDVHCEDRFLNLAISTLAEAHVHDIVCTGDIPTGQGDLNACCDLLRGHSIRTVRGNHDRWLVSVGDVNLQSATNTSLVTELSWNFLRSLPEVRNIQTAAGQALLCHGIGHDDMSLILPDQPDWEFEDHPHLWPIIKSGQFQMMINGHSHHRMVRKFESLTIINCGTLRRDHKPCFGLIDFHQSEVRFWDILDQQTAIAAEELRLP